MANEKRLISYDALIAHLDSCIEQGKGLFKSVCVAIKCFVAQMPTVDAVVLPCKVGDAVWTVVYQKVYKAKVVCIRPFVYKDFVEFRGNVIITYLDPFNLNGRPIAQEIFAVFGKDTFLTEEEAKAALAKMDGERKGDGNDR